MDLNHSNFVACIPVYKLCSNGSCWANVKEFWDLWAIFLDKQDLFSGPPDDGSIGAEKYYSKPDQNM